MVDFDRSTLIFETIAGSRAYGTATPESDEDLRGVYVEPAQSLVTLRARPEQVSDPRGDTVYYGLRRFLELALGANPNIIELLYMPDDCVRLVNPVFQAVLNARRDFITRQAYVSHVRYAQAQIKKARGRNKWINNPQPEDSPEPQEFCWFLPVDNAARMPFRPVPLAEAAVDLEACHASSVEHLTDVFRLYHYGPSARGVFRGGAVICESIPIEDECDRCIGLLIYNRNAHERAIRDHRNYWMWRKNRNEQRWVRQETGELDYDAKNMMHMFRLMLSAEHILTQGCPLVRFSGEKLTYLKAILQGKFSYESLIEEAGTLSTRLEILYKKSRLPENPDMEKAEELLQSVTLEWEKSHA